MDFLNDVADLFGQGATVRRRRAAARGRGRRSTAAPVLVKLAPQRRTKRRPAARRARRY